MKHKAPNVPYVQARHIGGKQKPTAIVISLSSTTSDAGSALAIAKHQHGRVAPTVSHHYILDEAKTYRGVPDSRAAYSNPYRSLSVYICAQPHEYVPLFEDGVAAPVLNRAADVVADLVLAHKIKLRYIDPSEKWNKRRWRRNGGIIIRAIGTWPYESFLHDVESRVEQKRKRKD
jgi:hypothetical protein